MFPGLIELLLIGCSIESVWTRKSPFFKNDTKNQLADILTKGSFTRDEWNHLLRLFNISHFSSAESGEEKVTAKSKPMMNSVSRCSGRIPDVFAFIASENLWKTRQESQSPLSAQAEMYDRTEKPVVCRDTSHERHRLVEKAHSSSYSEWKIDKTWSSQEWKSDELMDDRTGRLVVCPQGDEAESDLSLGSVRKRQKQSSMDAPEDSEEHSVIW